MCAGAAGASAPSAWPQRSGLSTGADSLLTAALRGGPGRLHALAAVSEPGRVDALASPIAAYVPSGATGRASMWRQAGPPRLPAAQRSTRVPLHNAHRVSPLAVRASVSA